MKELFFNDEDVLLKPLNKQIINITGKVSIKEMNTSIDHSYIINIKKNSTLNYDKFDKSFASNVNIIINLEDDAILNYHYAFECMKPCKINILSNLNGNNIKNNIHVHGVTSKKGSSYVEANAIVKKNTINNVVTEEIKVLKLNNEESIIKPNLQVSTNNIMANHNTTCKMVDHQSLFYLMSKGISEKKAIKLIKEGFLNS